MRLETQRLVLRQPREDDLAAFTALYGDTAVMRLIFDGAPWSAERSAAALDGMMRRWDEDGFGIFVVERGEDGAFLGDTGLLPWDASTWTAGPSRAAIGAHAEVEIGWTLAHGAWGRGYATEGALAVRDWALAELGMRHVISLIHPDNAASIRIAEKLGARHERDVVVQGLPMRLYALSGQ